MIKTGVFQKKKREKKKICGAYTRQKVGPIILILWKQLHITDMIRAGKLYYLCGTLFHLDIVLGFIWIQSLCGYEIQM